MGSRLCETNQKAYEEAGFISPRAGIKVSQQLFKNPERFKPKWNTTLMD